MAVSVKRKKNALVAWRHHNTFSSGMHRLNYAQLCLNAYVTSLKTSTTTGARSESTRNNDRCPCKKIFVSRHQKKTCQSFLCILCSQKTTTPQWIENPHFLDSESPICSYCIEGGMSTTKKSSSGLSVSEQDGSEKC